VNGRPVTFLALNLDPAAEEHSSLFHPDSPETQLSRPICVQSAAVVSNMDRQLLVRVGLEDDVHHARATVHFHVSQCLFDDAVEVDRGRLTDHLGPTWKYGQLHRDVGLLFETCDQRTDGVDEAVPDDFLSAQKMLRRMGPLQGVLKMIPGMNQIPTADVDESHLKRVEAIVLSMTPHERAVPHAIDAHRRERIARGSGSTVPEVNQLLEARKMMEKMMKQLSSGKMPSLPGMPPMPGAPAQTRHPGSKKAKAKRKSKRR